MQDPLTAYKAAGLVLARYNKLEDARFVDKIARLQVALAFAPTLQACEREHRSLLADCSATVASDAAPCFNTAPTRLSQDNVT